MKTTHLVKFITNASYKNIRSRVVILSEDKDHYRRNYAL